VFFLCVYVVHGIFVYGEEDVGPSHGDGAPRTAPDVSKTSVPTADR
jgi:hypothetical protein